MVSRRLILAVIVIILAIILIVMIVFNTTGTGPATKTAQAAKINIFTNKAEYQQGEEVKMIISNYANNTIIQETITNTGIEAADNSGESYGIGLIEQYIEASLPDGQGGWVAVEPVWRCNKSCFEPCKDEHEIKSGKKKVFSWDQTVLVCDYENSREETIKAKPGRYRISSGFWNEAEQRNEVIYSNEFIITE